MCAPTASHFVTDYRTELAELAASIRERLRVHLRELTLEPGCGGVVMRGRARSFYGKQLAQHEVMRRGLVVLANTIVVARVVRPA